jgi:arylsulfatase A-like enzyme
LKPNILFILADDLGYADLSCYGRRDFTTPNIDRIAAEGMRFTQAYANSAVCTASRVALITGRYQYRLAVGLEEPLSSRLPRKIGFPPDHPTLPSILKKAGYQTALIGKWHLGSLPEFGPLQSGYDQFYGFRAGVLDYFTHKYGPPSTDTEDLWEDDVKIRRTGYLTDLLGSRAVEIFDTYAKSGRPFLISLHFNAPHWPWEAPGDEAEAQRLKSLFHYDGGTQRTYQRMIQQMDLQIGRVLQALDANGAAQNTIGHLHQRQWRRALCRHLAVHRQEDRAVGRRFAHSGGDPLARPYSPGQRFGAGDDRHGLAADLACGRRHRT